MMINIEKALKFPTSDSNWQTKVGVYFVVAFSIMAVRWMSSLFLELPLKAIFLAISEFVNISQFARDYETYAVATGSLVSGLITFPILLYLSGYIFETVRNIIKGDKEPMKNHGQIWSRIKLGLVKFLFTFLASIPGFLLVSITVLLGVTAGFLLTTAPVLSVILVIAFIVAVIISIFVLILVTPMIKYSMEYQYLTGLTIGQSININKISELISKNWTSFLLLMVSEVVSSILVAASLFSCCLVFLFQPIVTTYTTFALAHIYGEVYGKINKGG